jgi:DNA-binding YbaB/EbfC family protein
LGKRRIKRKKSPFGAPGGKSQKNMLQQLQGLQQEMLEAQEELAEMTVTATAGGGAVTAVVTGERRLHSLTIAQEVVDPEDVEMLQDLVIAAVNEGMEQVDRTTTERMSDFTAGLGIPGIA